MTQERTRWRGGHKLPRCLLHEGIWKGVHTHTPAKEGRSGTPEGCPLAWVALPVAKTPSLQASWCSSNRAGWCRCTVCWQFPSHPMEWSWTPCLWAGAAQRPGVWLSFRAWNGCPFWGPGGVAKARATESSGGGGWREGGVEMGSLAAVHRSMASSLKKGVPSPPGKSLHHSPPPGIALPAPDCYQIQQSWSLLPARP